MKYAIVSDIHANLEALSAVLEDAGDAALMCLGDIVGYGAQPNECVDIIRSRATYTVLGNHDLACSDGTGADTSSSSTLKSTFWTHRRMTDSNINFLLALPYVITRRNMTPVHSSPACPEGFSYVDDVYEAEDAFEACDSSIIFIGHSHLPGAFMRDDQGAITDVPMGIDGQLLAYAPIEGGARFIVNPGSTGQPRDSDPRASYVLYDDENLTITWRRIEYDIAGAQAKIRATALPRKFADRLEIGH
jgi:predicted phosphodiesterase